MARVEVDPAEALAKRAARPEDREPEPTNTELFEDAAAWFETSRSPCGLDRGLEGGRAEVVLTWMDLAASVAVAVTGFLLYRRVQVRGEGTVADE